MQVCVCERIHEVDSFLDDCFETSSMRFIVQQHAWSNSKRAVTCNAPGELTVLVRAAIIWRSWLAVTKLSNQTVSWSCVLRFLTAISVKWPFDWPRHVDTPRPTCFVEGSATCIVVWRLAYFFRVSHAHYVRSTVILTRGCVLHLCLDPSVACQFHINLCG